MAFDDSIDPRSGIDPMKAFAQAMANAAQNATIQQQQASVTAQSAVTMGVSTLYALDVSTLGIASEKLLRK